MQNCIQVLGGQLRSVLHRIANRSDVKPITQSAKRWQMARFPKRSNSYDADPKFHKEICRTTVASYTRGDARPENARTI
jgi:hypothetical protein